MGRKALYLTISVYVLLLIGSLSAIALGFSHVRVDKNNNFHIVLQKKELKQKQTRQLFHNEDKNLSFI